MTTVIPPAPSQADPTVRRASGALGGPLGRYARPARRWNAIRIILALASFTLLLGYAEKAPCASGAWTDQLQYTHACYSDVIPLWSAEGLSDGAVPYRDHAVEYPVLTGGFMWVTAELTHGWHSLAASGLVPGTNDTVVFGALTCLLLAVCGLVAVAATAGAAGSRRRWDVAIFAASPLLVFHAFSNWDLFAMAFTSGALWAWARSRPVAAGVLIGLGAAAKLYPALLLFALLLLAFRTRMWRPVIWCGVAAVGSWLAVNLPVATAWGKGWWEFYSFSETRPAEASTFWAMLKHYWPTQFGAAGTDAWTPPGVAVAFMLLLALAAVGWFALTAPVRPRLAQLAFLTVAAFLLTTKVWSPQYSVWLVPLVALAYPQWRAALVWQATEIAVWIGTMLWLLGGANPNKALTYEGLTALLLLRDAVLIALMVAVVVQMHHPERDPVRGRLSDVTKSDVTKSNVTKSDANATIAGEDPGEGLFALSGADRRLRGAMLLEPDPEISEDSNLA